MAKKLKETYIHTHRLPLVVLSAALQQTTMEAYQLMQTYAVLAAGITQYFQYSEHNCDFICYWLVKIWTRTGFPSAAAWLVKQVGILYTMAAPTGGITLSRAHSWTSTAQPHLEQWSNSDLRLRKAGQGWVKMLLAGCANQPLNHIIKKLCRYMPSSRRNMNNP